MLVALSERYRGITIEARFSGVYLSERYRITKVEERKDEVPSDVLTADDGAALVDDAGAYLIQG